MTYTNIHVCMFLTPTCQVHRIFCPKKREMVRKTKAEAEKTRTEILDAAETVFLEKGAASTSLEEIAREAGVTRGAVYWHFANKADIIDALIERTRFPQQDTIARIAEGDGEDAALALEAIEKACFDSLNLIIDDPQRQRVQTIVLLRMEALGDALERRVAYNRTMRQTFTRAFEVAHTQTPLAGNWTPRLAAYAASTMMQGMVREWLEDPERFDLRTDGLSCLRSLFASFKGE